jgi:exodeoxyribonuclease VII small subunit
MAKSSLPNIPAATSVSAPATFELALAELEAIVHQMETSEAPLEQSLAAYERGMVLLKHCQETLTAAEQKLQMLDGGTLRTLLVDEPEPEA